MATNSPPECSASTPPRRVTAPGLCSASLLAVTRGAGLSRSQTSAPPASPPPPLFRIPRHARPTCSKSKSLSLGRS